MPKTARSGAAKQSELPATLQRSDEWAQRTYAHAYDAAIEQYDGDEEAAHRVAFAALKHTHEKVGDHWEPKEGGRKGPSDSKSARPRGRGGRSGEGVDEKASKEHLYRIAKRLDISGRSGMDKKQLLEAIRKANRRETREAR